MSARLIEKVTLPNGLILELWDNSRLTAGDRWLVSLMAKVEVPVLPEYFSTLDQGEQAYRDLVDAHGDPLVFTREKTRHFVDGSETKETITGLCRRFKDNLLEYLGNPKFAPQYVLKKYGDLRDRQNWSTEAPEK
jgi:hypothetical protein